MESSAETRGRREDPGPRSRKVLQAIGTIDAIGGAQRHLADVLPRLDPARVRCDVAFFLGRGELADRMRAAGAQVFDCAPRPWDPIGVLRAARILLRERYDVIHCHLSRAEISATLAETIAEAAGGRRAAIVLHKHNEDRWWERPPLSLVHRAITARADAIAVLSPRIMDFFADPRRHVADPAKMTIVPLGVDVERLGAIDHAAARRSVREELGVGAGAPIAIAACRLAPQKRLDVLLEAWRLVRERIPGAVLLIAGRGELESELRAQAARLPEGSVRFLGFRDDVPTLLAGADLLAISSDWEGMPIAMLEAMAAHVPVVSTAVAGISDAVRDGIEARLVPPRAPAALADAIVETLRHPASAATRADAAQARVRAGYSLDAAARAWEALYARLAPRDR